MYLGIGFINYVKFITYCFVYCGLVYVFLILCGLEEKGTRGGRCGVGGCSVDRRWCVCGGGGGQEL